LDVDDGAHDLADAAELFAHRPHLLAGATPCAAEPVQSIELVPLMMSSSSEVIAAWRARLYCRVRLPIIWLAFLVAESMAVMRAPCSPARLSSRIVSSRAAKTSGT